MAAIAAAERIPCHEAMTKARTQFESLFKRYQAEGEARIAKAAEAARPRPRSQAELAFDDRVDEIAKRDKCSRSEAMKRARAEHRAAFEAYQAAWT